MEEDRVKKIQELIAQGCEQVSRKYRMLARIPAGETGLEALKRRRPDAYKRIMDNAEHWAANEYRRYDAQFEGNLLELSYEDFNEYLLQTGRKPAPLELIKERAIKKGTYREHTGGCSPDSPPAEESSD